MFQKPFPHIFLMLFIAVTMGLGFFVAYHDRANVENSSESQEAGYRKSVETILVELIDKSPAKDTGEQAETKLLALIVPPRYQQFHLELVLALHDLDKKRFDAVIENSWLKK